MAKISIIVPIYNIPLELLKNCIESLINQTLIDIEIILVDDGNVGEIPLICKDYAVRDKRIKVISQENAGVSVARNKGLKLASAPYVAFVDADDLIAPETFRIVYDHMLKSQADVVLWEHQVVKEAFQLSDEAKNVTVSPNILNTKEAIEALQRTMMGHKVITLGTYDGAPYCKLYKRSILKEKQIEFVPELRRSQDNEFNFRYFMHVKKAVCLPIKLYYYVQFSGSAKHRYNPKGKEVLKAFLTKMQQNLKIYEKESDYADSYHFIVLAKFADICRTVYAHPQNPNTLSQKVKAISVLSQEEPFVLAFRETKIKEVKKLMKLIIPLVRIHAYFAVYLLFRLRYILK